MAALAFLLISSCSLFSPKPEPYHVEVLCPDLGIKILIRNTNSGDFWEALEKFNNAKKERGSSEDYTVLVFRNNHSMQFKGIKPEDMIQQCFTKDTLLNSSDSSYVIY